MKTPRPIFHRDNSVSYFWPAYGWNMKIHPAQIQTMVISTWSKIDRERWAKAMLRRGFIKRGGQWVPAHEIKAA